MTGKENEQDVHTHLYWEWPKYNWGKKEYTGKMQAVWKMLRHDDKQPWQLYDISKDLAEENDLSDQYADVAEQLDQNIGRVIKQLKTMGVFENTMILFVSDNGGCHTTPVFDHLNGIPGGPDSFPCYGYMGAELSNVPFRKYKQYIHEGGIETPLIAHYPEGIEAGQMCEQPGSYYRFSCRRW